QYHAFLGKGPGDEEKIFREFISFVGDPEKAELFHWTSYEAHHMKKLAGEYPAIASGLRGLVSACTDLMERIKKAFYLPAPGFSLKSVAPVFGYEWRQDDCGAMESMVYYWDWLKGNEEAIKKVLIYNEDDCVSMHVVDQALEKIDPAIVTWPAIPPKPELPTQ
ncbi:MAG: TM0106 family RecB-like putative nuclease, partial [Elusimicrobiaceae bacterium]